MRGRLVFALLLLAGFALPVSATTFYVRPDGGTRYTVNASAGQCDGKTDAAYPGTGVNQHCAFNDWRLMYDDLHSYGQLNWAMAGGDTVVLYKNAPGGVDQGYRVGFSQGGTSNDPQCHGGNGPYTCYNPPVPSGTALQHTRILGANYNACRDKASMTQINGGYGVNTALNLQSTSYVDVQCLEITDHSNCSVHGAPMVGPYCSNNYPLSDFDSNGIRTDVNTHDVLLQDLWIHGHPNAGILGPWTGTITATRIDLAGNVMGGWNLDDGSGVKPLNAKLVMTYSTIEWSGCVEQYPMVDAVPYQDCKASSSGGVYGDAMGTPAGMGMDFVLDHDVFRYNTEDGPDLGHIDTARQDGTLSTLSITNSQSYGNSGQQFKWGQAWSSVTFTDNIVIGNCNRKSVAITGAPSTYNQYLQDFCRANGDPLSFNFLQGTQALVAHNTIVGYAGNMLAFKCLDPGSCSSAKLTVTDNIFRGYGTGGPNGYCGPGTCQSDSQSPIGTIQRRNNLYFGLANCPANAGSGTGAATTDSATGEVCTAPGFVGEPATLVSEATLDGYNVTLAANSAAKAMGIAVAGLTADYVGNTYATPTSSGALEAGSSYSLPSFGIAVTPTGNTAPAVSVPKRLGGSSRVNVQVN